MKAKQAILLVILVAAVAIIVATLKSPGDKPARVESAAPEFSVVDAKTGQRISLRELRGKVVFVNFWASWCQPCKDEMPSVEGVHRRYAANPDFRMVTILYRDSVDNAASYMRSQGYTFPVSVDADGGAAYVFGVTGVPETYIVDKKGMLRKKVIGPADWNAPEEKILIEGLLKE